MPALIKPGSVKVITKDGEIQISITLDLNINLNSNGIVVNENVLTKKEEEKTSSEWMIPEFGSSEKINFGK